MWRNLGRMLENSPITLMKFNGYNFYIKRDDLLDRDFNGNKARKFYHFLKNPIEEDKIVSFGSNQSNAMYSLSVLAKMQDKEFIYYTNHLPQKIEGNLKRALENGMKLEVIDLRGEELREFVLKQEGFVIEEGGRIKEAEYGIKILADEINEFCKKNRLRLFLPSGTGTTAYFLAKHLEVEVLTVPCVGDENYLKKEFDWLGGGKTPTILKPRKKYRFGKLYKELFELWQNLDIEFDLLYDPIGWDTIKFYNLKNILYIHQGGLLGNETMIKRYKNRWKI